MAELSRLKKFMICTFIVATASFIVMFYYSVHFSKYKQIGIKYATALKNGKLGKGLKDEDSLWNNSSAFSNLSYTEEGKINMVNSTDLDFKTTQTSTTSTSSTSPLTVKRSIEEIKSTVTTTIKPISTLASSDNGSEHALQELCPEKSSSLVGPLYVDSKVPKMEDVEQKMSSEFDGWVDKGGRWKPTNCKARVKMALIIPYRNRYEQLSIFVQHMHPILKRQNLDYRIIVVEQAGDTIFNRAILFNIGFKEALKLDQYECFIFHDVDLIPEDDRNEYSCPTSPRHLSVAVDKFNYRLPYTTIFGGAGSFKREHFKLINGFSNKFWGWGGEDDDLYNRISAKKLKLTRPSMQLGRYQMIKVFHKTGKADPDRFAKLRDSAQRMGNDGLNTLKYSVVKLTEHRLYTLISVDVTEAMQQRNNK